MPSMFVRDIYKINVSVEDADSEQSDLFKMFGN